MSSSLCACPPPASIPDISDVTCEVKFGLFTRIAVQRKQDTSPFNLVTPITAETSWDTYLAAVDDTKIQLTPRFAETEIPQSEPITFGGNDNSTADGQERVTGETTPLFTAQFQDLDPAIKNQLTELKCEDPNLTVYLIDDCGSIAALSTAADEYDGIPITNFFVGTRSSGGRTEPDRNIVRFSLSPSWDNDIAKVSGNDLDFDILTKTND